jgi:hypothetical protein
VELKINHIPQKLHSPDCSNRYDRSPPHKLDCEGVTMRGWAFYDLECRSCGSIGLLGVWAETRMGDEVWSAEWNGFFGIVDRKTGPDPETVQCAACLSAEVNSVVRDEAKGADHAMQPAWA